MSPSFVKDYTHKDGKKIGTTLLAAAITNHPFLEGMQALTLYSFTAMGDLALTAGPDDGPTAHHLAELDQRVTFQPDPERTPELTDEERHQSFVVKSTIGSGDDQFVRLTTLDGNEFGWFRVTQLEPADAPLKQQHSPLPSQQPAKQREDRMHTTTELGKKAAAFAERVTAATTGRTLREAISLAVAQDAEGAEAYRLVGVGVEVDTEPGPTSVLSLSVQPGESFDALAMRYASERNLPLRDAVHAAGLARPDLAQVR